MDLGSVFALGSQVVRRAQLQLRHQGVVMGGELAQLAIFKGKDIGGCGIGGPDQYLVAVRVILSEGNAGIVDQALGCAVSNIYRQGILGAVILDEDGDGLAVR